MRLATLWTALMLSVVQMASSQEQLNLQLSHGQIYLGDTIPTVFYRFSMEEPAQWITEILTVAGEEANFTAIQANVSSVLPARAGDQRYLLYNPLLLLQADHPLLAKAQLAHGIGHHINQHQLTKLDPQGRTPNGFSPRLYAQREAEELAADEFTGFALYLLGAPPELMDSIPMWLPISFPLATSERLAALKRGYLRAEALLLLTPSAAYEDNGSGEALAGMPEFPFPPPRASCQYPISDHFRNSRTLADIDQQLRTALERNGYYERQYFHVSGGFAMVTRMEQFNQDGSCKPEPGRWAAKPVRDESFDWVDYLKALFTANPGYFRVFVFIVTDEAWANDPSRTVSREEAEGWLSSGFNRLPRVIGQQVVSSDTDVTALIYEFEVQESTHEATFSRPSRLSPMVHLQASQILARLR